jgi:tetratricopeptide (TPR) repeat protein
VKNNLLYDLIRSMSKAEKRYFKVFTSSNKTNLNLIRLFDALEKQTTMVSGYSEAGIKEKFKGESFVTQLAVTQNRLYQLILKSLRNFHSKNSNEIQLYDQLAEIEILYHKKLYANCRKLITKAKKQAKDIDNHLVLLRILKWETFLQKEEGKYLKKSQTDLQELFTQEKTILNKYRNLIEYKFHTFNFLLLSRNRVISVSTPEVKAYTELLATDHYSNPPENMSMEEAAYLHNLKAMYYFSQPDYGKSRENFQALVDEIEKYPDQIRDHLGEYFMGLNNLLLLQVMSKQYQQYSFTLEKLYDTFANHQRFEQDFFSTTTCYELGIYCELGDYNKGFQLLPEVEVGLKKFTVNAINKHMFYFNAALIYFMAGDFQKASGWLNKLVIEYNENRSKVISNIYYYSRLLHLMVQYEMENMDTLEYMLKSVLKDLPKVRPFNQYDKAILTFIQKTLLEVNDSSMLKSRFKALKIELEQILQSNPDEGIALQFFNFQLWIDSKTEAPSFAELVKQQAIEDGLV